MSGKELTLDCNSESYVTHLLALVLADAQPHLAMR